MSEEERDLGPEGNEEAHLAGEPGHENEPPAHPTDTDDEDYDPEHPDRAHEESQLETEDPDDLVKPGEDVTG